MLHIPYYTSNVKWGRTAFSVIVGLLILLIVGLIDDIRGMTAWKKLFWQIVAAVIVVSFGTNIDFLRLPFGYHLDLSNVLWYF